MVQRRKFVRLLGGGVVAAAGASAFALGSMSTDFPADAVEIWRGPGGEADVRRRAIAYAVTAPNPHNRQPWLLDLSERDTITLYCDRERLLPGTDPFGRQILIGHGAFIELLAIALAQQGFRPEVALWPEGELPRALRDWGDRGDRNRRPVARISLRSGGEPDPLFAHVLLRRSPKARFDTERQVSADAMNALLGVVPPVSPVKAAGTLDAARVQSLRILTLAASRVEMLTPATAMESLRLMRVGPDEILQHRDGISINGRLPRLFAAMGQFDRGAAPSADSAAFSQALKTFEDQSNTAMGFIWLATSRNHRVDQIAAGRLFVRQQLQATALGLGLGLHPMSQALQEFPEMASHRDQVHRMLLATPAPGDAEAPTLQMLCRVGYPAAPVPAAPRRPLVQFTGVAAT